MTLISRRTFIAAAATSLAAPQLLAAPSNYAIPARHQAKIVKIRAGFRPGEIHVDPGQFALYFTLPDQKAVRYPVGIGVEGRYYSGTFRVGRKAQWPRWTPTRNMIRREPHIYAKHAGGIKGGPDNPLGSRAIYLYSGGRDTLLRIHGTNRPRAIGQAVSNGCVRMINAHVEDLYTRVPNGTRVVLHKPNTM
jgi:lipoprotein-anchoring transpeptidase ErfK/SrfK